MTTAIGKWSQNAVGDPHDDDPVRLDREEHATAESTALLWCLNAWRNSIRLQQSAMAPPSPPPPTLSLARAAVFPRRNAIGMPTRPGSTRTTQPRRLAGQPSTPACRHLCGSHTSTAIQMSGRAMAEARVYENWRYLAATVGQGAVLGGKECVGLHLLPRLRHHLVPPFDSDAVVLW